ncbi:MAG TPA: ABC transporter ATP-binding protein [Gemmatimonadaceae bacterium]|nr:ABC transporter ATP-binding protein [Gemmatimonadaceae bacterium]
MTSLLRGVFAAAPGRALLALALTAAVGLTEGVTLLLLIPLLQLAGVAIEGSLGSIAVRVGATFKAVGVTPTLASVLVVYLVVSVIQASLIRARSMADTVAVQRYTFALRERLYSAIARAKWLVVSRIRSSDFTYALTTAIDQVDNGANNVLFLIGTLVVALVYAAVALRVSSSMTAIVLGTSILLLFVERARTLLGRSRGKEVATSTAALFSTASEHLGGLKISKSYGHEERHLSLFIEITRKVNAARIALTRAFASLRWQTSIGSALALSVILYLAVGVFHLPTAAILLLLFIFSRLVPRIVTLQQTFQEILSVTPALDTIEDLTIECERAPEKTSATQNPVEIEKAIELQNVSFSYTGSSPQLHEVSLELPAGKTSAIVGASGAGKTTIADVLLGLIPPDSGSVTVDGTKLDESHLVSWREQIGYVAQDTFLFNDTVRFNLDWAAPGASEEEMQAALASAAADFVSRLPNGIDTVIGERGMRLSGGERQRLGLARALLRHPRVLILDEATSSLDSENEDRIFDAIQRLHGEMTIVIITHRLATIRNADVIHVLDGGLITDSGTWEALTDKEASRLRDLGRAQGLTPPYARRTIDPAQ